MNEKATTTLPETDHVQRPAWIWSWKVGRKQPCHCGKATVWWLRRNDEIVGHFCNDHRPDLPVFEPYPCGVCGASAEYSNATPIARDGDIAELVFRVDCCLVRLDARGISDDVVRSIAASMTALELDDWRSELGTRLLVDDQT